MTSIRGLSLSAASIATTGAGLVGQILLLRKFGPGPELDLYFYALAIPSFLAGQISLVLGYYLVPFLNQDLISTQRKQFQLGLMRVLKLSGLALVIPGMAISLLMAPSKIPAAAAGILPWLAILSWTSTLIANLTAAQTAFLNARASFVLPALFPLISQAAMVMGLLVFGEHGILVPLIGLNSGALVAWALGYLALTRANLAQPAIESLGASAAGGNDAVWRFFRRASLLPLVLCIFSAHFFIDALMSPLLSEGDLSKLALAHRVNIGAVGVVVAAFAGPMTIALSSLADRFALRQLTLVAYVHRLSYYGGAVAAIIFFNAKAIATLLTGVRHTTENVQGSIADLLSALAIAGVPMLIGQFLLRAQLALKMHRSAAIAAMVWVVCYVAGALCSVNFFGAIGLAMTYMLAWLALARCALMSLGEPLRYRDWAIIGAGFTTSALGAWLGRELALQMPLAESLSPLATLALSAAFASTAAFVTDRLARKWRCPEFS